MAHGGARKSTLARRSRSLVALSGLVALVTGTFVAAAPAAAPAESPDEGENAVGTDVTATGAYEACSENFGYGKVVEIVVEVNGTVPTPPFTYPTDVQVVAQFDDGGPQICEPDVVTDALWDSESLWGNLLGLDLPAPVGNYVFLPYVECDTEFTLNLVGSPPGYIVKVGTALVLPPELGFPIFSGCSSPDDALPFAEPLMSPAAFTALTNFIEGDGTGEGCTDGTGVPSADLASAATALVGALDSTFTEFYDGDESACQNVEDAYFVFYLQTSYEAEVGRQAIFELTTPPLPPPPPLVTPTFTG